MLDNLYENIGGKIKNLAKCIFIVEAIGAVIAGLVLLFTDEDLILFGLLTLVCGPIVAYVSSWILYAFGELVEKITDNENNTRQILKKLNEKPTNYITEESKCEKKSNITSESTISQTNDTSNGVKENRTDTATFSTTEKRTIVCSQCKFEQPSNRKVCRHCGAQFEQKLNEKLYENKSASVESKTTFNSNGVDRMDTHPAVHKWRCDGCGKMRTQTPCEHCKKE